MEPVRFLGAVPQFTVRDVVRTAEYYRDVLGFEIAGYWDGERASPVPIPTPVFAIVGRGEIEVFFNRADRPDIPRGRAAGAYDAYLRVTGIDALAEELRTRGAEILDGPEDRVYGQRELVVKDCNGLILAFGEAPARPDGERAESRGGTLPREWRVEHRVLALTRVPGSTAACAAHGDARTAAVLADYYALLADAAAAAGGQVLKVMGDAALISFPVGRARQAVDALRSAQASGTSLWRGFDERCRLELKVGAGEVVCGRFGPPGGERPDVYGSALNRLFKAPWAELVLAPELETLLR